MARDECKSGCYAADAEGIEDVSDGDGQGTKARKEFRNGILYILRGGKTYTTTGQEIK